MAPQALIVVSLMLRLFDRKIESNLRISSMIAIMHGCVGPNAAQEASKIN
jgi:hypothetical protein